MNRRRSDRREFDWGILKTFVILAVTWAVIAWWIFR